MRSHHVSHTTPCHSPNHNPDKIPGIDPESSHTTSTIFPINPDGQPRNDTGYEALGREGFGGSKCLGRQKERTDIGFTKDY